VVFFDQWYCENGLPLEIVSDRDKLFMSKFWQVLHGLTGVKLKMSTAYHPQSDGASKRTNKTVNQCLRYHVERNQLGWKRALPRVRFDIMNTVNSSTGFSPFQLHMGRAPRVIPPLVRGVGEITDIRATTVIEKLQQDVLEAKDNMLRAKTAQSLAVNVGAVSRTKNESLNREETMFECACVCLGIYVQSGYLNWNVTCWSYDCTATGAPLQKMSAPDIHCCCCVVDGL
jgi:hypothetical protein